MNSSLKQTKISELRERCESNFIDYIHYIAPEAVWGSVHYDIFRWLTHEDTSSHKLLLLPRDHQKSRIAIMYGSWRLTVNPALRILYVSATSTLAEKQLSFIKNKITSKRYRLLWPDHINEEESKRSKWTNSEIELDHPIRIAEAIRDPSVFAAGLTTNKTGLHFDLTIFDDIVVFENAYTEEGRSKVNSQVSLMASVEGAESEQLSVGTRYHPNDVYSLMKEMKYDIFDERGEIVNTKPVYSVYQKAVEEDGELLWPRQQRTTDGQWFGFTRNILSRKKAQYTDKAQFYAQYYNNPNDPNAQTLDRSLFNYYDRDFVRKDADGYYVLGPKGIRHHLRIYVGWDLAFKAHRNADYSCLAVVGIDKDKNIYALDIERYRTDKIKDHFKRISKLHDKWSFTKMKAETVAGQHVIVKSVKDNYLRPNGYRFPIEEYTPTRFDGQKDERIAATLFPLYEENMIYHYVGGGCQLLEDELMLEFPPHDDVKDAFALAVSIAKPPFAKKKAISKPMGVINNAGKFGGFN